FLRAELQQLSGDLSHLVMADRAIDRAAKAVCHSCYDGRSGLVPGLDLCCNLAEFLDCGGSGPVEIGKIMALADRDDAIDPVYANLCRVHSAAQIGHEHGDSQAVDSQRLFGHVPCIGKLRKQLGGDEGSYLDFPD